jgi:hypothetical protein
VLIGGASSFKLLRCCLPNELGETLSSGVSHRQSAANLDAAFDTASVLLAN